MRNGARVACKILPDEQCLDGYVAIVLRTHGGTRVVRVPESDVARVDQLSTVAGTNRTSRLAALRARPASGTNRARVLDFLERRGPYGATDEEIQGALGMPPNSQRPRRVELVTGGWVVDSGARRLTESGNESIVWMSWTDAEETS